MAYLEAQCTNFVAVSLLEFVPRTAIEVSQPPVRDERTNRLVDRPASVMVPAGTIVTCSQRQALELLHRNRRRSKWQDVTKEVAAELKVATPEEPDEDDGAEPPETSPPPQTTVLDDRQALLRAAIEQLDPANAEHFTESGVPRTRAIAEFAKSPVDAAERDAVWATLQKADDSQE